MNFFRKGIPFLFALLFVSPVGVEAMNGSGEGRVKSFLEGVCNHLRGGSKINYSKLQRVSNDKWQITLTQLGTSVEALRKNGRDSDKQTVLRLVQQLRALFSDNTFSKHWTIKFEQQLLFLGKCMGAPQLKQQALQKKLKDRFEGEKRKYLEAIKLLENRLQLVQNRNLDEVKKLQARIRLLEAVIRKLNKQLERSRYDNQIRKEEKIKELKDKDDALRRYCSDYENQIKKFIKDIEEFERRVREAEKKLLDEKRKSQGDKALLERYQRALSSLQDKLDRARIAQRAAERERDRLEAQVNANERTINNLREQLERAKREYEQLVNRRNSIQQDVNKLKDLSKRKTDSVKKYEEIIDNLREKLDAQRRNFQKQIENLMKVLGTGGLRLVSNDTLKKLGRNNGNMNDFLKAFQDAIREIERKQRGLRELMDAQLEERRKEIKQLKQTVRERDCRIEMLEAQLRENNRDVGQLIDNRSLASEINRLKHEMAQLSNKNSNLNSNMDVLSRENLRLRDRLKQLEKTREDEKSELNKRFKDDLSNQRRDFEKQENLSNILKRNNDRLNNENENLKRQLKKLLSDKNDKNDEQLRRKDKELQELKNKFEDQNNTFNEVVKRQERQFGEIENNLQNKIKNLENENSKLRRKNDLQNVEKQKNFEKQLEDEQRKFSELKNNFDGLNKKLRDQDALFNKINSVPLLRNINLDGDTVEEEINNRISNEYERLRAKKNRNNEQAIADAVKKSKKKQRKKWQKVVKGREDNIDNLKNEISQKNYKIDELNSLLKRQEMQRNYFTSEFEEKVKRLEDANKKFDREKEEMLRREEDFVTKLKEEQDKCDRLDTERFKLYEKLSKLEAEAEEVEDLEKELLVPSRGAHSSYDIGNLPPNWDKLTNNGKYRYILEKLLKQRNEITKDNQIANIRRKDADSKFLRQRQKNDELKRENDRLRQENDRLKKK